MGVADWDKGTSTSISEGLGVDVSAVELVAELEAVEVEVLISTGVIVVGWGLGSTPS